VYNEATSDETSTAADSFDFGTNWSHKYSTYIVDPNSASAVQVPIGQATTLINGGVATLQNSGDTWELTYGGSLVASSASSAGWVVSLNNNSTATVTSPSSVTNYVGYQLTWVANFGYVVQVQFDILPALTIRQNMFGNIYTTGTDQPGTGLTWDIRHGGSTEGSSSQSNGWGATWMVDANNSPYIQVFAPVTASIQSGYEVRCKVTGNNGTAYYSATFAVAIGHQVLTTGTKSVLLPDRSEVTFNAPSVPSSSNQSVLCTVSTGTPFVVYWLYDSRDQLGDYKIVYTAGSSLVLGGVSQDSLGLSAAYYVPTKQFDAIGNYIVFNSTVPQTNGYASTSAGLPVLNSISQSNGSVLISFARQDPNGSLGITSASDCYGRTVYYTFYSGGSLESVSQINQQNSPLETYGYYSSSCPTMTSITRPSPTGSGTVTNTFNLNPTNNGQISSQVDAEGNQRIYSPSSDGIHTTVTIENTSGVVVNQYVVGVNSNGCMTSLTDSTGSTIIYSASYNDPNDPYQPSQTTDGDGHTFYFTYDAFGHVVTFKDPRGITTTNTFSYSTHPAGELTQMAQGGLTPTTFTYYEPNLLLESVTGPTPDGNTGTISYTYSSLGNVLTTSTPGNHAASTITTTFNYTQDGQFTASEALGEPLTVTDNLGYVTHLRYDTIGRLAYTTDPLGNQTTTTYNIADQPVQMLFPATGQTGTGQSSLNYTYLRPGGVVTNVSSVDESNRVVRSATYSYGSSGELLSSVGSSDSISYTYDADYRLSTYTNGNGDVTTYSYNPAGYTSQIVGPGGETTLFNSYSPGGKLLQATTPSGIVKNYAYTDVDGLLTSVTYPSASTLNQTLSYDGYGRLSTISKGLLKSAPSLLSVTSFLL
jgi:YD repeat-containing protein